MGKLAQSLTPPTPTQITTPGGYQLDSDDLRAIDTILARGDAKMTEPVPANPNLTIETPKPPTL